MMEPEVIFTVIPNQYGNIGHILLNRPAALNALSLGMLQALQHQLEEWQSNKTITAVVIEGVGDRAFCAGGDIRAVYHHKEQVQSGKEPYFEIEYHLNELIFNFSKPYLSILDGIAMGGGLGISIWGSHPIATERLVFAMPETAIGLFPDIGSSYFLTRLPKHIGWYLGLTGNTLTAYEALQLKLVKTVLNHQAVSTFIQHLNPQHILLPDPIPLNPSSELLAHQDDIDFCFSHQTLRDIIESLDEKDAWCQHIANTLRSRSPLSLKVTFDYLRKSQDKSFEEVMRINTHLIKQFLKDSDFFEGIRAAVVDKDKKPQWQHTIHEVDQIDTLRFFNH